MADGCHLPGRRTTLHKADGARPLARPMGWENSEELTDGAAQVSRLGFGVLRPDRPNRQRTDCKAVQSMLIAGLSCEADGPLLMVLGSDTNCRTLQNFELLPRAVLVRSQAIGCKQHIPALGSSIAEASGGFMICPRRDAGSGSSRLQEPGSR